MTLPDAYFVLSDLGLMDYEDPRYLRLTSVHEWYTPQKVTGQDIPEYWNAGFVPFAQGHCGDRFCWVFDWTADSGTGIALCHGGMNSAVGLAPDFSGFVYRALLEETTGSWLAEALGIPNDQLASVLRDYVQRTRVVLKPQWCRQLEDILSTPALASDDGVQYITFDQFKTIVRRDLAFENLDKSVKYTR